MSVHTHAHLRKLCIWDLQPVHPLWSDYGSVSVLQVDAVELNAPVTSV